jgi:hypothetical protein
MFELKVEGVINRTFNSPEELLNYFKKEVEFWAFLKDSAETESRAVRLRVLKEWEKLRDRLDREIIEHGSLATFVNTLNSAAQLISIEGLVPSESLVGLQMRKLWDKYSATERDIAIQTCWHLYALPRDPIGVTTANLPLAMRIIKEKDGDTQADSEHLHSLQVIRAEAELIRNTLNKLQHEFKDLVVTAGSDINHLKSSASTTVDTCLEDLKQRFENQKQAYDKELELRAPVQYWTAEADGYKKSQKISRAALIAICLIFLVVFGLEIWCILLPQIARDLPVLHGLLGMSSGQLQTAPTPHEAYLATMSLLLVTVSLFLLLFRPVWKMYLSAAHLATVFNEKKTMVQVYLALIGDGASISEADRAIVLNSIFSVSNTGLISNSDGQQLPIEYILRQFTQR